MIPRKLNTLYPKIANESEASEELVSDVVSFYWKEIRNALEKQDHIAISIDDFGTFELRKRQVEYQIQKYTQLAEYIKPVTYTKHVLLKIAIDKLERFKRLLKKCEEQEQRKLQIRKIQKNG